MKDVVAEQLEYCQKKNAEYIEKNQELRKYLDQVLMERNTAIEQLEELKRNTVDADKLYKLLGEWDASFAVTSDFRGTRLRKAHIAEFARMIEEAKGGVVHETD